MGRVTTRQVFERWLRDHSALDRIEFADIPRPRHMGERQSYTGPVVVLTRTKDL